MNNEFNMEEDIMTLTLDDDTELQCYVIGIFPAGDYEYIALDPIDDEYDDALVYRYSETEEGKMILKISNPMKSMRSLLMHSMNCLIQWNSTIWAEKRSRKRKKKKNKTFSIAGSKKSGELIQLFELVNDQLISITGSSFQIPEQARTSARH